MTLIKRFAFGRMCALVFLGALVSGPALAGNDHRDRRGDRHGDRHEDRDRDRDGDRHGNRHGDRDGDRHGDSNLTYECQDVCQWDRNDCGLVAEEAKAACEVSCGDDYGCQKECQTAFADAIDECDFAAFECRVGLDPDLDSACSASCLEERTACVEEQATCSDTCAEETAAAIAACSDGIAGTTRTERKCERAAAEIGKRCEYACYTGPSCNTQLTSCLETCVIEP